MIADTRFDFGRTTIWQRNITELLTGPVGRPSYMPVVRYRNFFYRRPVGIGTAGAGEGRVFHHGEFPPRGVHRHQPGSLKPGGTFYNKRGTAERGTSARF
jgi:hypothetical protein